METLTDSFTAVNINLPLPLDVTSTILTAIGSVYPSSTIEMGRCLTINIPDHDRHMLAADSDDDYDDDEVSFEDETVTLLPRADSDPELGFNFSLPESFALAIVENMAEILDDHNAPNYVEMKVHAPAGSSVPEGTYTVTVARPDGLSAHDLRLQAQNHVQLLSAQLLAAGITPVASPV